MLLDCFTIPCVMLFTFLIVKTKYNWRHLLGVVLCIGGLTILVFTDSIRNSDQAAAGPSPLFGDILCLVGAFLYGVSNTGQEISVKKWSQNEFLAMIGIFGAPINFIQLMVLERSEITHIGWNGSVIGLVIGFAILLFAMYSLTPHMMVLSGSTLFNLSLLTSDAYAIIFGIFLFHKRLHWAYWIALGVIIFGLCLYNIMNEPAQSELDQPHRHTENPVDEESLNVKHSDDLEPTYLSSTTSINTTTKSTISSEDTPRSLPQATADGFAGVDLDSDLTESISSIH
jgi:solute carrier family 35 protein F1/2